MESLIPYLNFDDRVRSVAELVRRPRAGRLGGSFVDSHHGLGHQFLRLHSRSAKQIELAPVRATLKQHELIEASLHLSPADECNAVKLERNLVSCLL